MSSGGKPAIVSKQWFAHPLSYAGFAIPLSRAPLNIALQLGNFDPESDAVFLGDTGIGIRRFNESFQDAATPFQFDFPGAVFFIKVDGKVDAAFSDFRINFAYGRAYDIFINHDRSPFMKLEAISKMSFGPIRQRRMNLSNRRLACPA